MRAKNRRRYLDIPLFRTHAFATTPVFDNVCIFHNCILGIVPNTDLTHNSNSFYYLITILEKTNPMRFACFARFMPEYGFVWG